MKRENVEVGVVSPLVHFSEWIEENQRGPQSKLQIFGPHFQPETSRTQSWFSPHPTQTEVRC